MIMVDGISCLVQWIGLRENLQETHGFLPSNMRGFPVNFPIIQFYEWCPHELYVATSCNFPGPLVTSSFFCARISSQNWDNWEARAKLQGTLHLSLENVQNNIFVLAASSLESIHFQWLYPTFFPKQLLS